MAELAFFEGVLAYFAGDGQASRNHLEVAESKLSNGLGLIMGEVRLMHGLALQMCGHREDAVRRLNQFIAEVGPTESAYLTRLKAALAIIYALSGDLPKAKSAVVQMKKMSVENRSQYAQSWGEYMDGWVHYNGDYLDHALTHFHSAVQKRYVGEMSLSVQAYIGLILTHQALQQSSQATEVMARLLDFVEEMNNPDFIPLAYSCQARLNLQQGNHALALEWAYASREPPDALALFVWIDAPVMTRARIFAGSSLEQPVREAVELLLDLLERVRQVNFTSQEISIQTLLFLAYQKLGKIPEARKSLNQALVLAEPRGWTRSFVDAGLAEENSFDQLESERLAPRLMGKLRLIFSRNASLTQKAGISSGRRSRATVKAPLLTLREKETLDLLATGRRNKEIASLMSISPNAVKKNLYRIFKKLGVQSRIELINKARDLGIL